VNPHVDQGAVLAESPRLGLGDIAGSRRETEESGLLLDSIVGQQVVDQAPEDFVLGVAEELLERRVALLDPKLVVHHQNGQRTAADDRL
jgi:hypothetical protein